MRTAFINQLTLEAARDERIFLVVGDLGYHVIEPFMEQFPDRFLNAGIAEQNMLGVAAGLAREGYNVYVYSIGNFPTLRCLEQIRNDVCYYQANVKVVSVGAGYSYGSMGVSHQATEDVGVLRALPHMAVVTPSDPTEAQAVATLSTQHGGPMYIRLGKAGERVLFDKAEDNPVIPGAPHCLRPGSGRNLILTAGSIATYALDTVAQLGVDAAIYTLPYIKPLQADALAKLAERYDNIIVLEEHQLSCGIGSAVIEQLNDLYADGRLSAWPKLHRVGVQDAFSSVSGTQEFLRQHNGLRLDASMFVK